MTLARIDAHQNSKIGHWIIISSIWNESRDEPLIYPQIAAGGKELIG